MTSQSLAFCLTIVFLTAPACAGDGTASIHHDQQHWPQWRGPLATGVAPNADPPGEWRNRVDARTGEDRPGPLRLAGVTEVYSSAVAAVDRIYITDRYGLTLVVSHSDTPRLLARNQLDDTFNASAGIAGRELFLRGEKALYCLALTDSAKE